MRVVIAIAVVLAACSKADEGPAPNTQPTKCHDMARCLKACDDAGNAASCLRASRFAAQIDDRTRAQALRTKAKQLFQRAAMSGDLAGCAPALDLLRGSPEHATVADRCDRVARDKCDRGEVEACEHLRAGPDDVAAKLREACDEGFLGSCERLAEQAGVDAAEGNAALERACKMIPSACLARAARFEAGDPTAEEWRQRALTQYREQCKGGDGADYLCVELVAQLDDGAFPGIDAAAIKAPLCELGIVEACD